MKHSRLLLYPQRLDTPQLSKRTYLVDPVDLPVSTNFFPSWEDAIDIPGSSRSNCVRDVATSSGAWTAICPVMLRANDAASCGRHTSSSAWFDCRCLFLFYLFYFFAVWFRMDEGSRESSRERGLNWAANAIYIHWPLDSIMSVFHHGDFYMLLSIIANISHGLLVGWPFMDI